ncbi:type II secretion system F family protein [Aquabacterium sp.]|uniref:type II secretion system F family protein n=1 Tax=Aquabacterium sp. TaxID=1872578 RepID=UPI0019ABC4FA|nr:type II secretion system F family protein [Aquabacterium sp.]MBC7701780.1 type II secretion system F family protein [Aquabacterium sp.]
MRFHLDVVQGRGAPQTLVMDATSLDDAKLRLQQQGYTILSAKAQSGAFIKSNVAVRPNARANRRALVIFIEQLHALLQAGLSLIEALETLRKGAMGPWVEIIAQVDTHLRQGQALSQAMEHQSSCFPPLLIAMVRSAEVTSDLPQALTRYLEHERRSEQVRHQITSVALYPVLLMGVGGSVMLFLLLYVMPRFARVFESMNNLPWTAKAMVSWSHLLKAHGFDLLLGAAVVAAALFSALAVPKYRAKLLNGILGVGPLARHLRIYFLARWYRTIGMLVEGGMPLPESLGLANQVLPLGMRPSGLAVEQAMRQGLAPSNAFMQVNMATPVAEQLLRAGERSGDVGNMLRRAAEFHENEVAKSLDKAMRVIEPVVMTVIGVGVGVVVVLMYLPIFELASAIQ